MGKGQVAFEFTVLIAFMVLLIIGVLVSIKTSMQSMQKARQHESMHELLQFVVNEVSMAQRVGHGYTREFRLPLYVSGEPYSIGVNDGIDLNVTYQNREYVTFLPHPVQGSITRGKNTIRNEEGNVTLNQP